MQNAGKAAAGAGQVAPGTAQGQQEAGVSAL